MRKITQVIPREKWHPANIGVVDLQGGDSMRIDPERGKALITSRAFWGVVIMAIGVVAPHLEARLEGAPEAIVEIVGLALALYGRVKATEPITGILTAKKQ